MLYKIGRIIVVLLWLGYICHIFFMNNQNIVILLDTSSSIGYAYEGNYDRMYQQYTKSVEKILQEHSSADIFLYTFSDDVQTYFEHITENFLHSWQFHIQPCQETCPDKALYKILQQHQKLDLVYLISDGQYSDVRHENLVQMSQKYKVSIQFVSSFSHSHFQDIVLQSIHLASQFLQDQTIQGYAVVSSLEDEIVQLSIKIHEKTYTSLPTHILANQKSRIYFHLPSQNTGNYWIHFSVQGTREEIYLGNNTFCHHIQVCGSPNIQIIDYNAISPMDCAKQYDKWKHASTVILKNGTAEELGNGMQLLHDYVAQGGSLFVMASPTTLGPGNYAQTILEKALPSYCNAEQNEPILLLLALDTSGSMQESTDYLQQAKTAILQVEANLKQNPQIQNIVLSFLIFSQIAQQKTKFQSIQNIDFAPILKNIVAHGSTSFLNCLQQIQEIFTNIDIQTTQKHVIILSDGMDPVASRSQELFQYIQFFQENHISISVFLTGTDSWDLLKTIAKETNGKIFENTDFSELTQQVYHIFQGKIKKSTEQIVAPEFPYLQNKSIFQYTQITPKYRSKIPIQTTYQTPILLLGQYILGKTAVLTVHPTWTDLPFERLQDEIVSWLQPQLKTTQIHCIPQNQQLLCISTTPMKTMKTTWTNSMHSFLNHQVWIPFPPVGEHTITTTDFKNKQETHPYTTTYTAEESQLYLQQRTYPMFPPKANQPHNPIFFVLWFLFFLVLAIYESQFKGRSFSKK